MEKIGLGGGCHWCTEAIYQSLIGIKEVKQGYIASTGTNQTFSEAVIVHYDSTIIPLNILIEIHLLTHQSGTDHSMREKYRSAIYYFSELQKVTIYHILSDLKINAKNEIITQILPFKSFESSRDEIKDYFYKNPEKPFCRAYIKPQLDVVVKKYSRFILKDKIYQHC